MTGWFFLSAVAIGLYQSRNNLKGPRDVLNIAGAIAVIILLSVAAKERTYALGKSHFRDLFHLPDNAEFVELQKPRYGLPSRAVVAFRDAEWQRFTANLNAQPTPFLFDFNGDPARHTRIARWRDLPPDMTPENAPKHLMDIPRLYEFRWDYAEVRNGKILCVVYVATTPSGARDCAESTKGDPLYAFVVGVLDFDRKRLHVRFRGDTGAWL